MPGKQLLIAVVLFSLAACGGSTASQPAAAPTTPSVAATPPESVTASVSPTRRQLKVSEETSCEEVVEHMQDGVKLITAINTNPDGSTVDRKLLDETVRAFEHDAAVAPDDMVQYIEAQKAPLEQLQRLFRGGGGDSTLNYEDYKSAARELLNRCTRYAR